MEIPKRMPKVLADELLAALQAADKLGPGRAMELLRRYRLNRTKLIAYWGVANIGERPPADIHESIPIEHLSVVQNLDRAFARLHHYRNGGAGDYAARDVETAIRSFRASGPRQRETNHYDICEYLKKRKYVENDNKKELVADAAEHFKCSESKVRKALSDGGLARNTARKKSTVN